MEVRPILMLAPSLLLAVVGVASFVSGRRQLQAATAMPTPVCSDAVDRGPQPPAQTSANPWTGVIVARDSISLASRVSGRVAAVNVRLGDPAKAGDLLARIDDSQMRADLAVARAGLVGAMAQTGRTRAEQEAAAEQLTHEEKLGDLASGEERMKAAQQARISKASLGVAAAQVQEQASRVQQMALSLAEADIRAPFEGVIAARLVDPGAIVSAGTPMFRLQRSNALIIRFAVPPTDAKTLSSGKRIRAHAESTNLDLTGEVERVAPEIDVGAGLVIVEAKLDRTNVEAVADGDVAWVGAM